jgi:hypothetical protein
MLDGGVYRRYSRSHLQQSGGEPEGFHRVGLLPLIFVLSLLANAMFLFLSSYLDQFCGNAHGDFFGGQCANL